MNKGVRYLFSPFGLKTGKNPHDPALFQSTGRSAPSKDDKDSFKKVLQSIHGRLSIKMEFFRRYLQTHGEPDGFPRLENDLIFYLEVQKLKVVIGLYEQIL